MDYASLNKTLTFSQETTVTTFDVFIVNDTVLEGTEQFFVSLKTLNSRVNLDPSRVPVRILDDDGKQKIIIQALTIYKVNWKSGQLESQ